MRRVRDQQQGGQPRAAADWWETITSAGRSGCLVLADRVLQLLDQPAGRDPAARLGSRRTWLRRYRAGSQPPAAPSGGWSPAGRRWWPASPVGFPPKLSTAARSGGRGQHRRSGYDPGWRDVAAVQRPSRAGDV